ncbi:hypothetical protein BVX98_00265 [bacterium F11]|nr:hypothetical protein BVX98_00265 [bacterium F11]
MMKLSTKTTYALRALIHLVRYSNGKPENLHTVSQRQNIPLPYLEQIFSKLKKADLVTAIRGPRGGFQISKPLDEINLFMIITALEGPFEPMLCSYPENQSSNCHEIAGCLSQTICNELDGAVMNILSNKTLGKICQEAARMH